jgi:DNA-binding transcriptional regulator YiaG
MSEILDIANEMARDLFKVGAMDEITMRKIDALCLPQQRPYQPEDIRRIRTANHVSYHSWPRQNNGAAMGAGEKKSKRPSAAAS